MKIKCLFLFTIVIFIPLFCPGSPNTQKITEWVMGRQQWNPTTRIFLKQYPDHSDSQILIRYLQLLVKKTLLVELSGSYKSLISAAEEAVEYCPGGVAELEYVLTGYYPEGPCILIALTESVWLEHLATIQDRIKNR